MTAGQFKRLLRGIPDDVEVKVGWKIDRHTIYVRQVGSIKAEPCLILVGSDSLISHPKDKLTFEGDEDSH